MNINEINKAKEFIKIALCINKYDVNSNLNLGYYYLYKNN